MAELNMVEAVNQALQQTMEADPKMLLFGEDVGINGGVMRATVGLHQTFGEERIFDTPLAESAIVGVSVGLALGGYRPVPEIQFSGFTLKAVEATIGQLARIRYRTAGQLAAPVTIRSTFGGGVATPEWHADSLEGLFAQSPGLRVVIPSSPYDAKGLLIAAIQSNDPVIFLEHLKLYRSFKEEVPAEMYSLPLDKANVVREGEDVTIIAYGAMVREALKVVDKLATENISVELIDLRTVAPFDEETILTSVKKTGRAVVVQEAQRLSGMASHIMALISEQALYELSAPIGRVTAPDGHYPFNALEKAWLPNASDIETVVRATLAN